MTAPYRSNALGDIDDRVRLRLGDSEELLLAESYTVDVGVFTQPAAFTLSLGIGEGNKILPGAFRKKYPPRTPFQIFIGDALQQTGRTDGFPTLSTSDSGGTSITFEGRDAMAPLHDACVVTDRSFADFTYQQLVEHALKESGVDSPVVVINGFADRKIRTGLNLSEIAPPDTVALLQIEEKARQGNSRIVSATFRSHIGETWYQFIRRHIDRAGLFLWSGADGSFILSRPARDQTPTFSLQRYVDPNGRISGAIESSSWRDNTTNRYSEILIFGRGGGKKFGRGRSKGLYEDQEMLDWGYNKPLTLRDVNVQSPAMAGYLAKRRIAEGRRQGWALTYTVAGHTIQSVLGGQRGVWAPDTVVDVSDELYDVEEPLYIENVSFSRSPSTTTTIRLMRPRDLVLGADEEL